MDITDLPALNATLNGIAATFLLSGWVAIKRGRERTHKKLMLAAVFTSALFLVSYLTYHFKTEAVTRFPKDRFPSFANLYYGMLLTHTVLAGICLPLVLLTLHAAMKDLRTRHRKLARWTMPIWVYVSITGVFIYLTLYHWCA